MKHKKHIPLIILLSLATMVTNAQESLSQLKITSAASSLLDLQADAPVDYNLPTDTTQNKKNKIFIGYDFGEAAFNKFQSLGSEIGIQFKNDHLLRLSYTNLNLTEEHLSSNFAKAVEGDNVSGKLVGAELFYDFPVLIKGLYLAPSIGYYDNEYTHTILDETLQKSSLTTGMAISYTEVNIFNAKGLYYRVSIPMRLNIDQIKETTLGDTIIKSNQFDNNIWMFVGYQF